MNKQTVKMKKFGFLNFLFLFLYTILTFNKSIERFGVKKG